MIKQHKKAPVIAAMAFTTLLSQAAWANEESTLSAPVFQADELSAAFEQSAEPMQMLALSEQEMKDTEGAWFNFVSAGWGALGGGVGYAFSTWTSGSNWSSAAFTGSVVGGAVGGFFVNPALGATVGAGVGGAISGWSSRYNW